MRRSRQNPYADAGRGSRVRPVTKIELDERQNKKRTVWAIALLAVGLILIGYGVLSALTKDPGWVHIEPLAETSDSVAEDMVLLYELGASDRSPNAEHKALANRYTELCIDAYRIFSVQYAFDGVQNLYEVNLHIGSAVEVHPALYRAFEQLERAGSRVLFAAPFYREYGNLFLSDDDAIAAQYDPRKSEEIAAYFAELSRFTASDEHIRLELLGNNRVKLVLSDAYRAFARESGIETFVNFDWTRNAFAVDYIAESLIAEGYTYGTLSSFDGFVRSLDTREVEYSYHLYAPVENTLYDAVRLDYLGRRSTVYLRAFPLYDRDEAYYAYKSGERRHPYVDVTDGLCKNAVDGLIAYSADRGCAEVLLSILPVYIADTMDTNVLSELKKSEIFSVYADETTIHYSDGAAKLSQVYQDETVKFTTVPDN